MWEAKGEEQPDFKKEQQVVEAPIKKLAHGDKGETGAKKRKKTPAEEEVAHNKEHVAQTPAGKSREEGGKQFNLTLKRAAEEAPTERTREGEGEPGQSKASLFWDCFNRVFCMVFRDSSVVRKPLVVEVQFLAQFCVSQGLPLVSFQQVNSWIGLTAKQLRTVFRENKGIQNLVGICPEELCIATEYAGQTLDHYLQGRLSLQHKYSVLRQMCTILGTLHHHGFVHNDLKPQNICVKVSALGPEVTFIDFGLTLLAGIHPRLDIRWTEELMFAPEICGRENPGPCSGESDAYSLGKLL
ncbi:uncharacterized protein LOC134774423 [Penaeus indicus]|uniref:uncharacterized protein LOC134774423 n=1 Tax=Penaeus indicus TaxID=29960 RepID=UPI00300CFD11